MLISFPSGIKPTHRHGTGEEEINRTFLTSVFPSVWVIDRDAKNNHRKKGNGWSSQLQEMVTSWSTTSCACTRLSAAGVTTSRAHTLSHRWHDADGHWVALQCHQNRAQI